MRALLTLLLLVGAGLTGSACDTYDNGYDDGYNDGQDDRPRVRVVDFEFDGDDYAVNTDGTVASFESDDIRSQSQRTALETALRTAGDGAIVVAYIDTELVIDTRGTGQTYSALPLTRAFEDDLPFDVDGDGTLETIRITTVLSYEYSFDNEDFYFDVTTSFDANTFGNPRTFFDFVIPVDVRLRVVTIPADIFNKTSVDLTDYAAVQAAFALPE